MMNDRFFGCPVDFPACGPIGGARCACASCGGEDEPVRRVRRGDTIVFFVQVLQPDQPFTTCASQTPPQDITGWKMWATAKHQYPDYDQQAVFQVDSEGGSQPAGGSIFFTQPAQGIARVEVASLATRGFPDSDVHLRYDVQTADPAGRIFTVEVGYIVVRPDVTRTEVAPGPVGVAIGSVNSPIAMLVGATATQSSVASIVAGELVERIYAKVGTTPFPVGTVVQVGQAGAPALFDTFLIDAPAGQVIERTVVVNAALTGPVLVTFPGGVPTSGSATIIVRHGVATP